jgi:trimeric autotransporter adhesin
MERVDTSKKLRGKIGTIILAASLAFQAISLSTAPNTYASVSALKLLQEQPITSGAILKTYKWETERNGKPTQVSVQVIEVDLHNPYVKIDTIAGTGGQFTKKQTVQEMAADTGAVAAVNGDFYNTKAEGVPMGPQVMDSQLLATPPYLPGFYSFAITKDRKPVVDLFTFEGQIVTKDGASYPLGGINKTYYWFEPNGEHSHIDGLFMYTNAWGQVDRSNDGVTYPTEVLVRNNVIHEVAPGNIVNMVAPKDGYILRAAGKADAFVREHMKAGEPIMANYRIMAQDPNKIYDTSSFQMMIGGHTILVDEGKPAKYSREVSGLGGYRSRTAIGYSPDERYVYLITADNSGDSKGLSLADLQKVMIELGVWKGLNLDGGGSTQLATRPLGEFQAQLTNATEFGSERKVVNGVGVYSMAPKGNVQGITISGNTTLFAGEKQVFQMKAYDEFYNPVNANEMDVLWSLDQPIGVIQNNELTAQRPGTTKLTVQSGNAKVSKEIEVVGKEQTESMQVISANPVLSENSVYKLSVELTTHSGVTRIVPPGLVEWEWIGFQGDIDGDRMLVTSIDPKMSQAYAIASFDGHRAMYSFTLGEQKLWADFDGRTYPITFNAYPAEVEGIADRVTGLPEQESGNRALYIRYDFTKGTGTKAAYALFGDKGIPLEGEPYMVKMRILGDNSLNWIRAEIVDAKGQLHRVNISNEINWYGWKNVIADLSSYNMAYPVTFKRLYVANPEQGQNEREVKGRTAFDDITFLYESQKVNEVKQKVQMAVNKKSLTVNGKAMSIDQAPTLVGEHTMVPVRLLVEAMGGQVDWRDEDRRVTVRRGDHLIDMWIESKQLVIDGTAVQTEAAPIILNERTMLPLRLIAESLGWKVGWDAKTMSITLE